MWQHYCRPDILFFLYAVHNYRGLITDYNDRIIENQIQFTAELVHNNDEEQNLKIGPEYGDSINQSRELNNSDSTYTQHCNGTNCAELS